MGYLWCPADWTKGEQTKAAVRLERGKELNVIRLEARDLHLPSVQSLSLVCCRATQQVVSGQDTTQLRSCTSLQIACSLTSVSPQDLPQVGWPELQTSGVVLLVSTDTRKGSQYSAVKNGVSHSFQWFKSKCQIQSCTMSNIQQSGVVCTRPVVVQ